MESIDYKCFKKSLAIVPTKRQGNYPKLYNNIDFKRVILNMMDREDLKKIHICLYNREVNYDELFYFHRLSSILYTFGIKVIIHFDTFGIHKLKELSNKHKDIHNMDSFTICKDNYLLMRTNPSTLYSINKYGISKIQ